MKYDVTVVTYDITNNASRSYFIKKLQHYGLKRIQKSVFIGYLEVKERLDLANDLETYLSKDSDSIIILPLCEKCKSSIFFEGNVNLPKNDLNYRFL